MQSQVARNLRKFQEVSDFDIMTNKKKQSPFVIRVKPDCSIQPYKHVLAQPYLIGLQKRDKEQFSPKLDVEIDHQRSSSCKTTQGSTHFIMDCTEDDLSDSEGSVSDVSSEDNIDINLGTKQISLGANI